MIIKGIDKTGKVLKFQTKKEREAFSAWGGDASFFTRRDVHDRFTAVWIVSGRKAGESEKVVIEY